MFKPAHKMIKFQKTKKLLFLALLLTTTVLSADPPAALGCTGRYSPQCEVCIKGTPVCIKCGTNFLAKNEGCIPQLNDKCMIPYCSECDANNNRLCKKCALGFFLMTNSKTQTEPKCMNCKIRMCKTCKSIELCEACIDGYELVEENKHCKKKAPSSG